MHDRLFRFLKVIFRLLLPLFVKARIHGEEKVPRLGPITLVANHISNFDPVVLNTWYPRKIRFMAKAELFHPWPKNHIMKIVGAFPVERGQADLSSIKTAIRFLKAGEVFGIFIGGTRTRDGRIQKVFPGAASIALKSNAPVQPVFLKKSKKGYDIYVGESFIPKFVVTKEGKEAIEELGQIMKERIEALAPKE